VRTPEIHGPRSGNGALQQSIPSREYDLTPFASQDAAWKRSSFYLLLAIIVGLGSELVYIVWSDRGTIISKGLGSPAGEVALAALFCFGGIIGFCIACVPRLLPGARSLRVDADGVHLFYGHHKHTDLLWAGRSRFLLYDYSAYPSMVADGMAYGFYGAHIWNRRSLVSNEAFEKVLETARERGADVTSHPGSSAWYGKSPMIHRVGGHEREN
jgi:hypothetical protein